MYCKHCGKQIDDDSKYCSKCGGLLADITPLVVNENREKQNCPEYNFIPTTNLQWKKPYLARFIQIILMIVAAFFIVYSFTIAKSLSKEYKDYYNRSWVPEDELAKYGMEFKFQHLC